MSKIFRSFGSDNHSGIHPEVMRALAEANRNHAVAYGEDHWTNSAREAFRHHFGSECEVGFVFNGTAANVLGIGSVTRPYQAVICAETAHIENDECGAPERWGATKLLTLPALDGKLTVEGVKRRYRGIGDVHHVQPRVVSITQSTEVGTVYRVAEIRALADFAHAQGMLLHMDGARLANAAASLDLPLRALTTDAGVDVLSFGGTKNGCLAGEAVVFLKPGLGAEFPFLRKQGMQLASKMRFLSAQFLALLGDDLFLRNARHANRMAQELAKRVRALPALRLTQPVEANGVFVELPPAIIAPLRKDFFFYLWNEERGEARWMCSFDTTLDDIEALMGRVRELAL